MSTWTFNITVDIDDDALAATKERDVPPYGLAPDEWDPPDFVRACEELVIDIDAVDQSAFVAEEVPA